MRPIRLQLKSFTAFRGEQEVDFSEFDVFAIAGPTGSGKSSLLDAMTYALFGSVERVGKQVGQLVSQGQPRMAVTLEFEIAGERYRVARSTPVKGATKILLERFDGDDKEWRQYGEGADRVRDVDAIVRRLVGLDYTAFTRSVLLPQGKFAEFLTGEAKDRRDILTELLGLVLFRRMAKDAERQHREAEANASAREDLLESEYAGATPEALADARREAKEATGRAKALERVERAIEKVTKRAGEAIARAKDLDASSAGLRDVAAEAARTGDAAARLAQQAAQAQEALDERSEQLEAARKRLAETAAERERTESTVGREADLAEARGRAEGLLRLRTDLAAAERRALEAHEAMPGLAAAVDRAAAAARKAVEVGTATEHAAVEARAAHDEAQHADLVAAVSRGLRAGDPCPVCGEPLAKVPRGPASGALERAAKAADSATARAQKAAAAVDAAARAQERAVADLERATADEARVRAEHATVAKEMAGEERRLAPLFGGSVPDDPIAETDARLGSVRASIDAEREAADAARGHEEVVTKARAALDAIAAEAAQARARLAGQPLAAAVRAARAQGARGVSLGALSLETVEAADGPAALATAAGDLAERIEEAAGEVDEAARAARAAQAGLLEEARGAVGDLLPEEDTLEATAAALARGARAAAVEADRAASQVQQLADRIERGKKLAAEVSALRERARTFRMLATELRADHLISFLQTEALQTLAAAGSRRLERLSEGRYGLAYDGDEFFVVDRWNAEERRSVKTLSGGETFLASLSLALALAEQVRSLSVTERAPLDSLFLDEGFGTLDPDSLRIVVDAIEQLGGDGRLVGVITHVRELAEQFPRIEVHKSPQGSRLSVEV